MLIFESKILSRGFIYGDFLLYVPVHLFGMGGLFEFLVCPVNSPLKRVNQSPTSDFSGFLANLRQS